MMATPEQRYARTKVENNFMLFIHHKLPQVFSNLTPNKNGVWMLAGGRCAVGVVLLATNGNQFAIVRKEAVKDYEFSGQLTLPGGLVRQEAADRFPESLERSLFARAEDEAGISADNLSNLHLPFADFAPTTRYTVKGIERFTIVLAIRARLRSEVKLRATRQSIKESFLVSSPFPWDDLAPANRLIVARAFADELSAHERDAAYTIVQKALGFCNAAASVVGLTPVPDPWGGCRG